ncbi:MAG: 2-amino-4-hydroxy-6-hydroxymethyldihydropteridine diphosphokinase, partial [Pseudomonadota bacterium]
MAVVAIALGSNLTSNDASLEKNLASALTLLDQMDGLSVSCASRWFRTPAYPAGSGPDFVNGAALIESQLEPHQILACLHEVEEHFGRSRLTRWAPRVLDLDLLFVGPTVLPDRPTVIDWMKIDRG